MANLFQKKWKPYIRKGVPANFADWLRKNLSQIGTDFREDTGKASQLGTLFLGENSRHGGNMLFAYACHSR